MRLSLRLLSSTSKIFKPQTNVVKTSAAPRITVTDNAPKDKGGDFVDNLIGQRSKYFKDKKYNGYKENFRFEIGVPEDLNMIVEFVSKEFVKTCAMFRAINLTYEDVYPFFSKYVKESLPTGGVFLTFADDKLVFVYSNAIIKKENVREKFPKINPGKFEILDDYGHLVDECPGSMSYKHFQVLVDECARQYGNFLPDDFENVMCSDCGVAHSKFIGKTPMVRDSMNAHLDYLRQMNCNYMFGLCIVMSSRAIYHKYGIPTVAELPYDKYKVHGEVVIKNISDNSTCASIHLAKI